MKYIDMPHSESPRTRIRELGGQALTQAEVMALALSINDSETAENIAALYREFGCMTKIPRHRIAEIKNLGDRTADAMQAIVEIVRREIVAEKPERAKISGPADAAGLVMYDMMGLEKEQLRVILLNRRNEVIRIVTAVQGSADGASVRIGELFREAIRENAVSILLVHNHPSGDPSPSPEDVQLTRAVVQTGDLMDIEVLDHVVVGHGLWRSIRETGLIRWKST